MKIKMADVTTFDKTAFAEPDAFYWPGYIWFWNDRLSRRVLSSQLRDMNSHKARSVWPLPAAKDFAPGSIVSCLEPDYLTPEYIKMYSFMVKEAHRLGMKVWLYDDGGWPSGMVSGRLVRENPTLARQWMEHSVVRIRKGETIQLPGNCVAAFLYQGPNLIRQQIPGENGTINTGNVSKGRVELFLVQSVDPALLSSDKPIDSNIHLYPDLLNPDTAQKFIRMTHEVFKKALGRYFGNTIPLIFTDEPSVFAYCYGPLPWTTGLVSDFKQKKGYDIRPHLPNILRTEAPQGMQERVDFFDWWSQRFTDAFFEPILKWCRKNRILFCGHLGGDGDSGTLGARLYGFGHPLRVLRKLDIPGVDAIWRQIFPGKKTVVNAPRFPKHVSPINVNHHFAKYASTVSHQEGKPWAITESFAIYGAGLTPEQMKWITDFQYVRGINIMTMGSCQLSTRDHFIGGGRPFYCPANSLWDYMNIYHTYTARLSYLLSLGKPAIATAVYYPVRDLWAAGPDLNKVVASHDALVNVLLENQCDFDLIDDDILERNSTRVVKGRLQVGPMNYHTICVSRTRWMNEKSKEKLSNFMSGGGKVLWVDDNKNTDRPEGVIDLEFSELERYLDPLVRVEPKNKAVRVCKRRLANGNLYFITNESLKETKATLKFTESLPPIQIDPESGSCYKPSAASHSRGVWTIPLDLKFAGAAIILFTREKLALTPAPLEPNKVLLDIHDGWSCRRLRSCFIGKHDLEVKKIDERASPVKLGDWRNKFGNDFSGDVEYLVGFECDRETAAKAAVLDLGKINYVCQAFLNGKKLGKKVWQPFFLPVKGMIRAGRNELRVIVTNTMANQYVTTRRFDKYPDSIIGPYHKITSYFEKEYLPSGLYGPVRISSLASP